jgi:hypothetical protein
MQTNGISPAKMRHIMGSILFLLAWVKNYHVITVGKIFMTKIS